MTATVTGIDGEMRQVCQWFMGVRRRMRCCSMQQLSARRLITATAVAYQQEQRYARSSNAVN